MEEEVLNLMSGLVHSSNFFAGTNPVAVMAVLREDGEVAPLVQDVRLGGPWRWLIGPRRTYLVCALAWRGSWWRAGDGSGWEKRPVHGPGLRLGRMEEVHR